jgi:hypothetical protein
LIQLITVHVQLKYCVIPVEPMTTFFSPDADLHFPDSDGKPIADNTEQFRWIVLIKENLEILFAEQPMLFIFQKDLITANPQSIENLWYFASPIDDRVLTQFLQ